MCCLGNCWCSIVGKHHFSEFTGKGLNKFMLKSPAIIKFSLGKFCNEA